MILTMTVTKALSIITKCPKDVHKSWTYKKQNVPVIPDIVGPRMSDLDRIKFGNHSGMESHDDKAGFMLSEEDKNDLIERRNLMKLILLRPFIWHRHAKGIEYETHRDAPGQFQFEELAFQVLDQMLEHCRGLRATEQGREHKLLPQCREWKGHWRLVNGWKLSDVWIEAEEELKILDSPKD